MALTKLSDLWVPDLWMEATREKTATGVSILNSGIVQRSDQFDLVASGAGVSANIPMWRDITDDDEEIQAEDTAPATVKGITTGKMVTTILSRVSKYGATALSAQVSGGDPVAQILSQLGMNRLKRRQKALLSIMRGIMGTGAQTPGQAQGALRALRVDHFLEDGATPANGNTIDADMFIDACALMGELLKDDLRGGAILAHSLIVAALEKADKESFKNGVESGLPFSVTTYRGIPIFVSDSLVRAGATSGKVFDTYVFSRGVIGYGEKPQAVDNGTTVDTAALQFDTDKDKNNQYLWDRTRYMLHPNGMKWVGTPAGETATNAELQAHGNWELVYATANRVGMVAIRTNG